MAVPIMMGRQHATCGLIAGVGFAACIPAAPVPMRVLVILTAGGASLLPDLDHPGATAARSIGFVTRWIAQGVDTMSMSIYHATRGPRDTPNRISGHRSFTHTIPACVLAGAVVGLLVIVYPPAAAVVCSLLGGLLVLPLQKVIRWIGYALAGVVGVLLGRSMERSCKTLARNPGFVFALVAKGFALWVLYERPEWSWVIPVAVTLGCFVHILGDAVTNSGIPLAWPLMRDGKRWGTVRAPVTFAAGDHIELLLVTPALFLTLGLSTLWVTGLLTALLTVWGVV